MSEFQVFLDKHLDNVNVNFEFSNSVNLCLLIGKTIKQERKKQGMSQTDLFLKTGISQANISRIEKGESNVTLKQIAKLCDGLNITLKIGVEEYGG